MTRKQLSLAFWWEGRKSHNNGNIMDPNYKRCRKIKTSVSSQMMNLIKFIRGCISYFIRQARNSHQQAGQPKQQTQKRVDLICCCATMSTLDDEEAIQGNLTNVVEEKVTIQKNTRETLARKVKFVSGRTWNTMLGCRSKSRNN
jgi:hypothetical protein